MKKKENIILVCVLVAIVLIIGISSAVSKYMSRIKPNPDGMTGNTPGNLMNEGLFAEHNGLIYFANPNLGGSLCSMKPDLSDVKVLTDDHCTYINVCDNYAFYIKYNYSEDKKGTIFRGQLYGIVRATLDGKVQKLVSQNIAKEMCMYGNTLIYDHFSTKVMETYYASIDGSSDELAFDSEISLAGLYGGNIFYSGTGKDHNVYTYNIATKTSSKYLEGNTYKACMIDGNLFYIDMNNGYALTKRSAATGETTVVSDKRVINYNVYGNKVFYSHEGSTPELRRCNIDGSNDELIVTGNVEHINCTSQYTFYNLYGSELMYYVPTTGGTKSSIFFAQ